MDIFTPSGGDVFVKMLDFIFGTGWQTLYQGTAVSGGGQPVAAMFQVLNSAIMAGLAIYFLYQFTHAVIGTSIEGAPLGKNLHNVYAPARMGLATAFLAPLPWLKGFCFLQALLLLLVSMSIGLADHTWDAALSYLAKNPGQVSASRYTGIAQPANKIFQMLVVREYLREQEGYKSGGNLVWGKPDTGKTTTKTRSVSSGLGAGYTGGRTAATRKLAKEKRGKKEKVSGMKMNTGRMPMKHGLDQDALGKITVSCSRKSPKQCAAVKKGVVKMIKDMEPAAKAIASYSSKNDSVSMPTVNAVAKAEQGYKDVMASYSKNISSSQNSKLNKAVKTYVQNAKSKGFAMAGSYLWMRSSIARSYQNKVDSTPTVTHPNGHELKSIVSDGFKGYIKRAGQYAYNGNEISKGAANGFTPGGATGFMAVISHFFGGLTKGLFTHYANIATGGDPLLGTSRFGHYLLDGSSVAIGGIAMYLFANKEARGLLSMVPWVGKGLAKIESGLSGSSTIKYLGAFIWPVLLGIMASGATLAYLLPAIPFLMYSMATIGTIIVIIEGVVAMPFLAATLGASEGEGWVSAQAREGIGMVMAMLLRPSLMVIACFFSYNILMAVDFFVGGSAKILFGSVSNNYGLGLFGAIAGIFILTGFLTSVYLYVFGIIRWIPMTIPKFISGSRTDLAEHQAPIGASAALTGGAGFAAGAYSKAKGNFPKGGNDKVSKKTDDDDDDDGGGKGGGGKGGGGKGGGGSKFSDAALASGHSGGSANNDMSNNEQGEGSKFADSSPSGSKSGSGSSSGESTGSANNSGFEEGSLAHAEYMSSGPEDTRTLADDSLYEEYQRIAREEQESGYADSFDDDDPDNQMSY